MKQPQNSGFYKASQCFVWGYAMLILFPFLWIAMTAFKRQIDILSNQFFFTPILGNFEELIFSKQSTFFADLLNSGIVAISSTAIVVALCSMAAFTLLRMRVPMWLNLALFGWAMLFHMLPPITFVGAWFAMFSEAGLINTYSGLILAHVTINLPMGLWLMSNFLREVPRDLYEAASIDGCSNAGTFFRIVLPLVRPGMIATSALIFIFSWSDFTLALNLSAKATQTVPVSIATFAQEFEIKYGEMAAGSLLSTLPALLLILFGQRFIVKGLLSGAVK